MQATSTPTLAQPKNSGFAAVGAAAILAGAIGLGAIIGVNVASKAISADTGAQAAYALNVQRNGETGALTPAQRGLLLQRQGEIGAGAVTVTTPTGTTVTRIGGRDGSAAWNRFATLGITAHDLARDAGGWYATAPLLPAVIVSSHDAFRAANGWYASAPAVVPSVISNSDQSRAMERTPFPIPAQDPATNLSDYFGGLYGGSPVESEGNSQPVGPSHR